MHTNFNPILMNTIMPSRVQAPKVAEKSAISTYSQSPIKHSPTFRAQNNYTNLRTQLTTQEEHAQYTTLMKNLDKQGRKSLDFLLKTGILLNNNSNDKSTTLTNLHKLLLL